MKGMEVREVGALLVKEDITSLGLNLTFDEVSRMSENTLKSKLKVAVKCAAFKYLTELQQSRSRQQSRSKHFCRVIAAASRVLYTK